MSVKIDTKSLLAEVQERNRRWRACPRHHFPQAGPFIIGKKLCCDICGVEASLVDIGNYVRGYTAAGGDPQDVFPAWTS